MQNYRNMAGPYQNCRPTTLPAPKQKGLEHMPIAMAYVPWQTWRNVYDAEKGLCRGTIFQELDLPFCGIGGCQK